MVTGYMLVVRYDSGSPVTGAAPFSGVENIRTIRVKLSPTPDGWRILNANTDPISFAAPERTYLEIRIHAGTIRNASRADQSHPAGLGHAEENAERTADILSWADLHGVDSHGMSMLPATTRCGGRAKMDAPRRRSWETPISALVDGGGGLGHVPAHFAMQVAIDKAKVSGMAISWCATQRISAPPASTPDGRRGGADRHGLAPRPPASRWRRPSARRRLGTDPWSFAAPIEDGKPFLLDMATTTVAAGRIRNKANEGLPTPPVGWTRRTACPAPIRWWHEKGGFLTSLGGSPEGSSYKGYGLAAMVNILAPACRARR